MQQPTSRPPLRYWAIEYKGGHLGDPSIAVPTRYWAIDDPSGGSAVFLYSSPPKKGEWPDILLRSIQGKHDEGTVVQAIKNAFPGARIERAKRTPGEQHPRIWRGPSYLLPKPEIASFIGSVNAAQLLTDRFKQIALIVEPCANNRSTFGHEMRHLLILAATEIESAWKAIHIANNFPRPKGDRYTTQDYCVLIGLLRLREWGVSLSMYPDYGVVKPFEAWDRAKPTANLQWYAAYNSTKHDREANLKNATLENVISALAGLFVMLCAQFSPAQLARHPYSISEFSVQTEPQWDLLEEYVPIVSSSGVQVTLVPLNPP